MKIHSPSLLTVALGCALLSVVGCNKQDRDTATAKVKEAAHETKEAVVDAWGEVKHFSFSQRDDFAARSKALQAQMDVQLSELRASYSEAQATASRRAAMAELKDAESDYKQRLDALGTATADTWEAARSNVILAWDKLEAAYRKALTN